MCLLSAVFPSSERGRSEAGTYQTFFSCRRFHNRNANFLLSPLSFPNQIIIFKRFSKRMVHLLFLSRFFSLI